MKTIIKHEEEYCTIAVSGELDATSSIKFDNAIKEVIREGYTILFDLEELSYISSAGLGVFVSYLNTFEEKNITTFLYGLRPSVNSVLSVLGLDQLLTIVPSKEDALDRLHAQEL